MQRQRPTARQIGAAAELAAEKYLETAGLTVVEKNFSVKFGEIDIVARDGDTLVFVEVKYRRGAAFGAPHEFVTRAKMERIRKAAWCYIKMKNLSGALVRFDVISIGAGPTEHFRNAFA